MLRPRGLLAVTELESFPRFLTDPAGAALEDRIHAAMARGRDEAGMHMHEDWPTRLGEAGFAVESERRFVIALQPPPDSPMAASVARYATVTFRRARHGLQDKLSAGDIAELDALAPALSARDDLTVRTSRTVWGRAGRPARSCDGTVALMLIPAGPAGKFHRVVPLGPPARWSWTQPCPWSWIAVVAQ